jgi:hypothetical protein
VQDVRVELYIPAAAARAIYEDEIPDVQLPSRPVMLGELVRDPFAGITSLGVAPYLNIPRFDPSGPSSIGRRIEIENSGSARIKFDVGDLYPRETSPLDEFFLFANHGLQAEPPTAMPAGWSAVTRNLSGVQSGALEIPCGLEVPTVEELLAEQPDGGDEASKGLDDLDD